MPSGWGDIDTGFPQLKGGRSTEDKLASIQDYLFMLVESLGYTLRNLDISRNMNRVSVDLFSGQLTQPLYGRIEGTEGKLTELGVTAEGIAARVSNAEGSLSSLTLTAQGLQTQVSNVSGQVSSLSQTVYGFELYADNGYNFSYLTLSSGGINFGSAIISFAGMVAFNDLSTSGRTTINGANITSSCIC